MNIKDLRGELAHKPRPCYLAYGPDPFLRHLARSALADLVPPPMRLFNFTTFSAPSTSSSDLRNELEMLPVAGDYRVCLVTEWHKAPIELEEAVSKYLDNPNPATVLGLVGESADMRRKLSNRLKTSGLLVECKSPEPNTIANYIKQTARDLGYELSNELAALVVDLCGSDLGNSVQATIAMADYAGERKTLIQEDALALLGKIDIRTAFNLVDALGKKQAHVALELALRLLEGAGEVEKMVGLIERQLRLVLIAKAHANENSSNLARVLGVAPYYVKDYVQQSKNFTMSRLEGLLVALAKLDVGNKTGRVEGRQGLELFILEACRK